VTRSSVWNPDPASAVVPVVFGPNGSQLMGIYHAPDPRAALAIGVVLCNPLGYEAMCAHRTYRHLAKRLATAGFDVLRFDYHGTGDSSGRGDEPDRLRAWIDSVGAAVDELRAIAGVTAIDLFGVRFGGTLATLAASERRDIRDLVLWAPVVSGRAYVRELRALQRLKEGRGQSVQKASNEQGGQAAGDPFEPATQRDLSAVNLLALRTRFAERALILSRDDLPTREKELALHLQECGVETEPRSDPGYAGMMDHPETAVVPSATLDAIVAWLRRPEAIVPRRLAGRDRRSVLVNWSDAANRAVREEALSFGDGGRLFGILTESEPSSGARTAIIFLNAGANHRVGPNRLYVSLARDLAARGYAALRFDLGGLGDSGPAPGMAENQIYSEASIADVKAAMTFLTSTRGAQSFVLVGICSGASLAFHTSAEDGRVAGQIMINPQTFERKKGDPLEPSAKRSFKSTRYYLQALWRPSVWALALRGELDVRGVAGALRKRSAKGVAAGLRALMACWRGLPEPRTEVERVFRAVSDRGVRSLLVFSWSDGGLDMIEQHLGRGASSMQEHAHFRLEIVEGADHTFTQADAQHRLNALIARFIETSWPKECVDDPKSHGQHSGSKPRDRALPETPELSAVASR
jgi:pimeloyl-ACP methyl ester carboxylesterase